MAEKTLVDRPIAQPIVEEKTKKDIPPPRPIKKDYPIKLPESKQESEKVVEPQKTKILSIKDLDRQLGFVDDIKYVLTILYDALDSPRVVGYKPDKWNYHNLILKSDSDLPSAYKYIKDNFKDHNISYKVVRHDNNNFIFSANREWGNVNAGIMADKDKSLAMIAVDVKKQLSENLAEHANLKIQNVFKDLLYSYLKIYKEEHILNKLVKFANKLDTMGLYNEADLIDSIIKDAADLTDEQYEKYYGKPKKPEKKVVDIKDPDAYKQYYGKEKEMEVELPKPVEPQKQPEKPQRETGDAETLSQIIQSIRALIDDEFANTYRGVKVNTRNIYAGYVSSALYFDSSFDAKSFIDELPSIGFSADGIIKYKDGNKLLYSGSIGLSQHAQIPRAVMLRVLTDAFNYNFEDTGKELLEAQNLMSFYL